MLKASINGSVLKVQLRNCTIAIASALFLNINTIEGSQETSSMEVTSEELSAFPEEKSATFDCLFGAWLTEKDKAALKQIMEIIRDTKKFLEGIEPFCEEIPEEKKTCWEEEIKKLRAFKDEVVLGLFWKKHLHLLGREWDRCLNRQEKKYIAALLAEQDMHWADSIDFRRMLYPDQWTCGSFFELPYLNNEVFIGKQEKGPQDGCWDVDISPEIEQRAMLRSRLIVYILRLAGVSEKWIELMPTTVRAEVFDWFIPEQEVKFSLSSWSYTYWPEYEGKGLAQNISGQVDLIIELLNHGAKFSHFVFDPDVHSISWSMESRGKDYFKDLEKKISDHVHDKCPDANFEVINK